MQWALTLSKTAMFETVSEDDVDAEIAGMKLIADGKYDCKSIHLELIDRKE